MKMRNFFHLTLVFVLFLNLNISLMGETGSLPYLGKGFNLNHFGGHSSPVFKRPGFFDRTNKKFLKGSGQNTLGLRAGHKSSRLNNQKKILKKDVHFAKYKQWWNVRMPFKMKENKVNYLQNGSPRWKFMVKNFYYDFIDLKEGEEHSLNLDSNCKVESCNLCSPRRTKCWAMEIAKHMGL